MDVTQPIIADYSPVLSRPAAHPVYQINSVYPTFFTDYPALSFDFKPYLQTEHTMREMALKFLPETPARSKRVRLAYICPHSDKIYYAKGLCKACYHAKGRTVKATACQHTDRVAHAKSLCIQCYQRVSKQKYRKKLKLKRLQDKMIGDIVVRN